MPDILLFLPRSDAPLSGLEAWLERHARPLPDSLAAQAEIFGQLGLSADTAIGPITALGLGLQDAGAFWCLAHPLHLRADLSSVLLFGPESLAMTDAEAGSLMDSFNAYFVDRGFRLLANPGQGWLLRSESCLGASLGPIEKASLDIRSQGPEARPWQALLLEIQMLFHTHPINGERQLRGLPVINGLWPEGCGSLADMPASQVAPWLKMLVSDAPWVKGLAHFSGLPCASLDTAMNQGQVWYLSDGHDRVATSDDERPCPFPSPQPSPRGRGGRDECLAICHQALAWQAANKGAEVWFKIGNQLWQLRQPGLLSKLFGWLSR